MGPIKPDAGVTVASPATIPVIMPTSPGLPFLLISINIQVIVATAADMWVTSIAIAALAFAPIADPALKPNHPIHSIAAPIIAKTGL